MNFDFYNWKTKLPSESLDICEENFKLFFKTMFERQMIWKKRFIDKQERPWSEDEFLSKYKFTNVYRELDRNSQWQIKNIILNDKLSLKNYVWKILIFRIFNNPSTFEFIRDRYNVEEGILNFDEYNMTVFDFQIAKVREEGINPFTNAYLINSAFSREKRDTAYTKQVVPYIHNNVNNIIKCSLLCSKPEELIKFLNTIPGVSNFISHEFFQDFTYIEKYTERKFFKFNQNDYTNVGPGASVGIRLIYPSLKDMKQQKEAIYKLRDIAGEELKKIGDFPFLYFNKEKNEYYTSYECNITLHQIEMWLCEFQKYWKMIIGEGKQRTIFNPR